MTLLNEPGPGLEEKLYERIVVIEQRERCHRVARQQSYLVYFSGELIGGP